MATVIFPTAYSIIKAHPIIQAIISPKATYEYVYADPETGTIDANSAYAKAAKLQAKAVNKKRKITAGPPSALALPIVLKIPAPTIAAIPNAVKSLAVKCLPKALCPSLSFCSTCFMIS